MRLIPLPSASAVGRWSARYIASRIRAFKPDAQRPFVLGLPTGSTPLDTYHQLVAMHQNEGLSFHHVITFNMDEYIGLPVSHPCSFRSFMERHFFDHIDIQPANINFLNGEASNLEQECLRYEALIQRSGGIHLFLGGIGHDGHIAFNMPMSPLNCRTRVSTLTEKTRQANARFFDDDIQAVPSQALTVGIQTLLEADEVLILATGSGKAVAVREAIEGAVSQLFPVTALQQHPMATLACDDAAAGELKVKTLRYFESLNINDNTHMTDYTQKTNPS
ncbi:glucosamine-6-phosphate deaminase [Endozoicomonadaceae bacterium StTr2]